jgi:hypothetical protein
MTVIAILNFVVAGLGGVCLIIQASGAAKKFGQMGGGGNQQAVKMQEEIERKIEVLAPGAKTFDRVQIGVNGLLTILLIVGGVGLLNMQQWGRITCLIYAVLSLLMKVAILIYTVAVVLPALKPLWQELARNDPQMAQAMELGGTLGGIAGPCIMSVYPIVVLIFMLLPSTGKAFREWRPGYERPEDFDRYEDERRRDRGEDFDRRGPDDRTEDERWGR